MTICSVSYIISLLIVACCCWCLSVRSLLFVCCWLSCKPVVVCSCFAIFLLHLACYVFVAGWLFFALGCYPFVTGWLFALLAFVRGDAEAATKFAVGILHLILFPVLSFLFLPLCYEPEPWDKAGDAEQFGNRVCDFTWSFVCLFSAVFFKSRFALAYNTGTLCGTSWQSGTAAITSLIVVCCWLL